MSLSLVFLLFTFLLHFGPNNMYFQVNLLPEVASFIRHIMKPITACPTRNVSRCTRPNDSAFPRTISAFSRWNMMYCAASFTNICAYILNAYVRAIGSLLLQTLFADSHLRVGVASEFLPVAYNERGGLSSLSATSR